MAFRCLTTVGSDLCFNGGICVVINSSDSIPSSQESCECPSDWIHDFMWFHTPNCSMPRDFYLWFLIAYSIIAAPLLVYAFTVASRVAKHKEARDVILAQVVSTVLHWVVALALFLEQGFFEATIVLNALALLWSIYHMHMAGLSWVLKPLLIAINASPSTRTRAYRLNSIPPVINAVSFVIVFASAIAVCRDRDAFKFNVVICAFMCLFALSSWFHYIVSDPLARRLYVLLDMAGTQNAQMLKFRENAEKSRHEWNRMLLMLALGQAPIVIIFLVLGSFPFFYIYQAIFLVQIFPITYIVIKFFTKKVKTTPTDPSLLQSISPVAVSSSAVAEQNPAFQNNVSTQM